MDSEVAQINAAYTLGYFRGLKQLPPRDNPSWKSAWQDAYKMGYEDGLGDHDSVI